MAEASRSGILVIKLGALGDFVQALGPMAAIRAHHRDRRITLLTTAPFADFAGASGYFDDIWTDGRPGALDISGWLALRHHLHSSSVGRVYDLQTSGRSSFYYRLFWPHFPEWSGIAGGCSHPHANPDRDNMHTLERQAEQLALAGIPNVPNPDLSWAKADISKFDFPERFALLVPGGTSHRPAKQWPPERFGELAATLEAKGILPVLLGLSGEADIMAAIRKHCPEVRDLSGQTDLLELATLGRGAALAVGNDTGPMHLFSLLGCPSVVLYSNDSDPALCGQRGPETTIIRRPELKALLAAEVMDGLDL